MGRQVDHEVVGWTTKPQDQIIKAKGGTTVEVPEPETFEQWLKFFDRWRKDIGFPAELIEKVLPEFAFETKFSPQVKPTISFGDYAGQPKWEKAWQIPDQRIRDGLLNLIIYQGDTEFASVEQQRQLAHNAPSESDQYSLMRVMCEEMRHGLQMCYLMVTYFGRQGRREAAKQLARRSWNNQRLLGSFNQPVDHWLDFYTYTMFVDRDGKFQLTMLQDSGFAPLSRSMGPMLKEESFHLGTGYSGLKRIIQAGKIPTPVIQRYLNKWASQAYDLFGTNESSSANWAYVWGLKHRFDEARLTAARDEEKSHLNERARLQYYQECAALVDKLNSLVTHREDPPLVMPDRKFNRYIGDYADQCYTIEGQVISDTRYEGYLAQVLPTEEDLELLAEVFKSPGWLVPQRRPG